MPKIARPKTTYGETLRIDTSCGHIYVTVTTLNDQPFEVFATLGRSGVCERCQLEAIARCISTGLRWGIPAAEYIKQLQGIQCPKPYMFPPEDRILSCADAIAKAIAETINPRENYVSATDGSGQQRNKPDTPPSAAANAQQPP